MRGTLFLEKAVVVGTKAIVESAETVAVAETVAKTSIAKAVSQTVSVANTVAEAMCVSDGWSGDGVADEWGVGNGGDCWGMGNGGDSWGSKSAESISVAEASVADTAKSVAKTVASVGQSWTSDNSWGSDSGGDRSGNCWCVRNGGDSWGMCNGGNSWGSNSEAGAETISVAEASVADAAKSVAKTVACVGKSWTSDNSWSSDSGGNRSGNCVPNNWGGVAGIGQSRGSYSSGNGSGNCGSNQWGSDSGGNRSGNCVANDWGSDGVAQTVTKTKAITGVGDS